MIKFFNCCGLEEMLFFESECAVRQNAFVVVILIDCDDFK